VQLFPNPDNYARNVIDAEIWGKEHLKALELIYQTFDETGKWPHVEDLQRDLIRQGDTRDLVAELAEMPASLGVAQHTNEVSLSARGLSLIPSAVPLLEQFVAVIRLAAERYRGEDPDPHVTDNDLRELGMDAKMAHRVASIVFRESWPFAGGSGEPHTTWERSISLEMRHLLAVQSIEDYLGVQAALRYGPPPATPPTFAATAVPLTPEGFQPSPSSAMNQESEPTRGSESTGLSPLNSRSLTSDIALRLVFKVLAKFEQDNYFVEAFDEGERIGLRPTGELESMPPRVEDPEAWLMLNLGIEGLWRDLSTPRRLADHPQLASPFRDQALLLAVLELLHRDAVSRPVLDEEGDFEGFYDRGAGQSKFRSALAPILARLDPPLEMRSDGEVVPVSAQGLEELTDQPLPASLAADDVREKVQDAVRQFRDREATPQNQLTSLGQLAGVLERLRADGRLGEAVQGKDEGALFDIANNYAIRHDKPGQKRDYGPAYREWIFHAYLGAIRLALRVVDDDNSD
jgi:hypothetical protein